MARVKTTFVIPTLCGGGAERAVILLAEGLVSNNHEVTVVTLSGEEDDVYSLPEGAARVALNMPAESPTKLHAVLNNARRLRALRSAIRLARPDVVISSTQQMNVVAILALARTGLPVIAVEQTDPIMHSCGRLWDVLRYATYPRASAVVSVSRGVDRYFDWLPQSQRIVIHNSLAPVDDERDAPVLPAEVDTGKKRVVAMGRLTDAKAFDLLLYAFGMVAEKHADWQLLILGEGELRLALEELRERLGLTDRVFLPGRFDNPFPVLKKSDLFVLSSRFEGFPNVLIEAMACGVPVISTDCPSGPNEIISDNENGVLVPSGDACALAAAMDRLMSDEPERMRLAAGGREVRGRFSLEAITDQWQELIERVVERKARKST